MYKCFNCGKELEYTVRLPVMSGEFWGAPFTEYDNCCPYCKSNDISEIKYRCDCCHFIICEGDIYYEAEDGSIFCEECITKKEA